VTSVITVPSSLDDQSFEQVLEQVAAVPADARLLVDARHCRFVTPYGLTALLTLAQTRLVKPGFAPPDDDTVITYWARAAFFRYAEELFEIHGSVPRPRSGGESDQLLEVTPVAKSDDVHGVVEGIRERAATILSHKLHLPSRAIMGFAMTLSEACQNIVEHAGRGGWVAVQAYKYRKRLQGRMAVEIAVSDAGVGFRQSLEARHRLPGERWDDAVALERGVIQGMSRFPDPGRGQGLKGIRGYVHRWKGKLAVRSGTARVGMIPPWDDDEPRREGLPFFPGAQLQVTIPEEERP